MTAVGLRATGVIVEWESDSSGVGGISSVANGLETCCIGSETGFTEGSFKSVLRSGDKFAERRSGGTERGC